MIRPFAHHHYSAGRLYITAKLGAVIVAVVALCVLGGLGGAWVALNLRNTDSTPQPSSTPTETVEPEPLGTVVPL